MWDLGPKAWVFFCVYLLSGLLMTWGVELSTMPWESR